MRVFITNFSIANFIMSVYQHILYFVSNNDESNTCDCLRSNVLIPTIPADVLHNEYLAIYLATSGQVDTVI